MSNWDDLSIKERAELIHLYMDGGVLDLPFMRKHYNLFAKGGSKEKDKDKYIDESDPEFMGPVIPRSVSVSNTIKDTSDRNNIRGLAKKVKDAANSAGKTAKEIMRLYYDKEALRAKHYSSKNFTFDEAYADARGKGQRTFYWDGKYYNTDYEGTHGKRYKEDVASGKAAAFQEAYPGFTNPELRKEKQEELDTYGITNEQTRNKTFVDKNLLENLPIATTNYNVKGAGEYVDAALSAAGVDLRKRRDYNRYQKEVADEFNANHLAQLRTYLGFPLSGDLNGAPGAPVKISEFKPTVGKNDTEYYYTFKEDPFGEPVYSVDEINAKYRGTKDYPEYEEIYKKEPLEYSFYYPVADAGAADHEPYQDNNKSYLSASMGDKGGLGIFTISNTPEYRSFYDLWDFTTDIGRPYSYYDRHYYKGKPDVDKLYETFEYGNR